MNRSDRDPDAYDRIRDDRLGTNWPDAPASVPCDICGDPAPADAERAAVFHTCNQDKVRARIAELEAQLAAAGERERALINMLTFFGTELSGAGRLRCKSCFQFIDEDDDSFMTGHSDGCLIVKAANHNPIILLPGAAAALAAAQPASDGGEDWVDYDENSEENEGNG